MNRYVCGIVLMAAVGSLSGCKPAECDCWYRDFYNRHCEQMADRYRSGDYEWVSLFDMADYFQDRVGKMTVAQLRQLLGEPRIVRPDDCYYVNALTLSDVYDFELRDDPDWHGGDRHDLVLHYGESGPPHGIPDESFNLFFVANNGTIVGVWCLAP